MAVAKQSTTTFRGLNNVVDEMRLPRGWLTQADNVNITPNGAVVRARGFTQASSNFAITGAYSTIDFSRMFVVDTGELREMHQDMSYTVLATGLASKPMYFEEVNGLVFCANGVDFLVVTPTGVRSWGLPTPPAPQLYEGFAGSIQAGVYQVVCTYTDSTGLESGSGEVASISVAGGSITIDPPVLAGHTTNVYITEVSGSVFYLLSGTSYHGQPLGEELQFIGLTGPRGSIPALYNGCMYTAEAFPSDDLSVVWASEPLQYHHFNTAGSGVAVPGTVRMLKAAKDGLLIGTDRAIYAYADDTLTQLVPYGVVPGWHASKSDDAVYFWSERGLCRALPFINLTESQVSVPPGLSAGAMVIEEDGMRRYVVALHAGGEAFNRSIT